MTAAVATRRPLDITERRNSLLALIRASQQQPVTTRSAQALYGQTPWNGIGRKAARRDLRDLARRGHLLPVGAESQRSYLLNPSTVHRHPVGVPRMEFALLQAIVSEGGEWTPGRAKVVLHRAAGTHIYRSVARRFLEDLHRKGLLELHSECVGHCFYTSLIEGGAA